MVSSIILVFLWLVFSYYLFYNRRFISINVYVLAMFVAFLQPVFLVYDMRDNIFVIETNYQIIINRFLILCTFFYTLYNKIKLNNKLMKLSKSSKNLLLKENRINNN